MMRSRKLSLLNVFVVDVWTFILVSNDSVYRAPQKEGPVMGTGRHVRHPYRYSNSVGPPIVHAR